METSLLRRAGAELLGAYVLVTAGCGAVIVETQTGALGHVGVAFTFGLAILVMVSATGHVSGGHLNPAVTTAFAITKHFPWKEVPAYVIGQILGATLGALTLLGLFGNVANLGTTLPAGGEMQSFFVEIILTAVLMFVITSVATDGRAAGQTAAIAIGFTILLDAFWGGPISGGSMNPARSLGPALVSGTFTSLWVYIVAPIIGATIGAFLYEAVRGDQAA